MWGRSAGMNDGWTMDRNYPISLYDVLLRMDNTSPIRRYHDVSCSCKRSHRVLLLQDGQGMAYFNPHTPFALEGGADTTIVRWGKSAMLVLQFYSSSTKSTTV